MRIKGYVSSRRNTTADWIRKHIRPDESELVHEIDTNKFKLGDGLHYMEDPELPYFIDEVEIDKRISNIAVGGQFYIHEQITPASNWIITHTFGRIPIVAIYIEGELVETDVFANDTQVSIVFPSPASGKLVLT